MNFVYVLWFNFLYHYRNYFGSGELQSYIIFWRKEDKRKLIKGENKRYRTVKLIAISLQLDTLWTKKAILYLSPNQI